MTLYHINVVIHVLAALVWLGGMFFFALVVVPVLRGLESKELRARLASSVGRRFRTVGWICIAVLLGTGVINLYYHGVTSLEVLSDPEFWRTRYGTALIGKLTLVLGMLTLSALHDFVLGPRWSSATPGTPEAEMLRRRASWLGRLNTLMGLVLVYYAVLLARGG